MLGCHAQPENHDNWQTKRRYYPDMVDKNFCNCAYDHHTDCIATCAENIEGHHIKTKYGLKGEEIDVVCDEGIFSG